MFIVMAREYLIATLAICFLAGCSQEISQKAEISSTTPEPRKESKATEITQTGEALFRQFCYNCHPEGDNVSDPKRSLYGSVLRSNNISTPEDIVKTMRNPTSRMMTFDVKTISDKDAYKIAEYVLKTFM